MASNNAKNSISTNCCAKLLLETTEPSISKLESTKMMSSSSSPRIARINMPFSGLVICVTGLSKEARNQVMEATERLGGEYSGSLHPKCTHLVVENFGGRKFDHALKHGARNGLFVVTLGWFVDSARKNMRLNESLYSVKSNIGENGMPFVELNQCTVPRTSEFSCLPLVPSGDVKSSKGQVQNNQPIFSNQSIYIDPDISSETKNKILDLVKKDAKILDHWFIGSHVNYVICEGPSIQKYIVHSNNLVTPLWVLKTIKDKSFQRLVHLSSDLAKHVALVLEKTKLSEEDTENRASSMFPLKEIFRTNEKTEQSLEDRKKIVDLAKQGVRDLRTRRMHVHSITPTSLLDTICWSVSEPTTLASSWSEETNEKLTPPVSIRNGDDNLFAENLSRPLKETEKREVVFKNHLITILFPIDRFGELGPTSRTFFSNGGFTCIQLLDLVYNFYQEDMSNQEIEVAIHTDSRHADRLRALFASNESIEQGFVSFKRIDFMGSRRSFESLKRLSGESNYNVYELLVRA